jgi:hypothetical protein
VRVVAYSERTYEGYVDRVSPLVNRAKGAVPVRVQFRIPAVELGLLLKPEMAAVVIFRPERVTSPLSAAPDRAPDAEAARTTSGWTLP